MALVDLLSLFTVGVVGLLDGAVLFVMGDFTMSLILGVRGVVVSLSLPDLLGVCVLSGGIVDDWSGCGLLCARACLLRSSGRTVLFVAPDVVCGSGDFVLVASASRALRSIFDEGVYFA